MTQVTDRLSERNQDQREPHSMYRLHAGLVARVVGVRIRHRVGVRFMARGRSVLKDFLSRPEVQVYDVDRRRH